MADLIELNPDGPGAISPAPLVAQTPLAVQTGRLRLSEARDTRNAQHQAFNEQLGASKLKQSQQHYNLEDERMLLENQKFGEAVALHRYQMETARNQSLHAMALIGKLTDLNPTSSDFPLRLSKLLVDHAPGADSKAAQTAIKMATDTYTLAQKANETNREETFKATLPVRLKAISGSDHVSPEVKTSLVDPQSGAVNVDALQRAEAQMQQGNAAETAQKMSDAAASKIDAGANEFYKSVMKDHGLSPNDLNQLVATPSSVIYTGIDATTKKPKPVSAETVIGNYKPYTAEATLSDKKLTMPLSDFQGMIQTHKNIQGGVTTTRATTSAPSAVVANTGGTAIQDLANQQIDVDPLPPVPVALPRAKPVDDPVAAFIQQYKLDGKQLAPAAGE